MRQVLLAVGLLVMTACAGVTARQEVLLPAMEAAWVGIRADIESGMELLSPAEAEQAEAALAEFDRVFETGDRAALADTNWPALAALAADGIQVRVQLGQIGPGVAASKLERLRLFHNALVEMVQ